MDENINSTIEAALQDKMIDSAREADLTISFLRNQLWKEEEQIKTAAARERQAVEHLSSEIDFAKRKLIEKFPNLEVMEAKS